MKLDEVEIGKVYEFKGGGYRPMPMRVLEKKQQETKSSGGKWRKYWAFKIVAAKDQWPYDDPCPEEIFTVVPAQLKKLWEPPKPKPTMVPLEQEDVGLLTRLAFQWNLSPQEAMRRALREAIQK